MAKSEIQHIDQSLWSRFGLKLSLIAWLAMVGFDFFLHGGLLADIYIHESSFLLSPLEAFYRIPFGYLGFLIYAAFLVWISIKIKIDSIKSGTLLGLGIGSVIWISLGLGMYSITTAEPSTLIAWAIGQSIETAFAGSIIGIALKKYELRKPFFVALFSALLFVVVTIILQSAGVVQSVQM